MCFTSFSRRARLGSKFTFIDVSHQPSITPLTAYFNEISAIKTEDLLSEFFLSRASDFIQPNCSLDFLIALNLKDYETIKFTHFLEIFPANYFQLLQTSEIFVHSIAQGLTPCKGACDRRHVERKWCILAETIYKLFPFLECSLHCLEFGAIELDHINVLEL